MYRGTTPVLTINVKTDLDLNDVEKLYITFKSTVCEKSYDETQVALNPEHKTIIVQLSQEDTLEFNKSKVEVQLRMRMLNGKAYASKIANVDMNRILKEGVI